MKTLPDPNLPWPICKAGVALAADKEDLRLSSYLCPAGKWTNGWGETDGVGPGMTWTKVYADQRFCDSLGERTRAVKALLTEHASDNELAAMVVLTYNIGVGAFSTSSVLNRHNKGDRAGASRAFLLFNKFKNKATGQLEVSHGLTIRRTQESALYLTPDIGVDTPSTPMPQVVANQAPLTKSPTNVAGLMTAAGGGLGVLQTFSAQARDVVDQIRGVAESVGVSLPLAISACAVVAGGVVVYRRYKQRKEGVA